MRYAPPEDRPGDQELTPEEIEAEILEMERQERANDERVLELQRERFQLLGRINAEKVALRDDSIANARRRSALMRLRAGHFTVSEDAIAFTVGQDLKALENVKARRAQAEIEQLTQLRDELLENGADPDEIARRFSLLAEPLQAVADSAAPVETIPHSGTVAKVGSPDITIEEAD